MARVKPMGVITVKMNMWNWATRKRKYETLYILPGDYSIQKIYAMGKSRMADYGMHQNDIEISIDNILQEKWRITWTGPKVQTAII